MGRVIIKWALLPQAILIYGLPLWAQSTPPPLPPPPPPTPSAPPRDLQRELDELRRQVAELERQNRVRRDASLYAHADVVHAVVRDAERRTVLGDPGGVGAGHDAKGFYIRSDDGFELRPGLQLQFRGVANAREGHDDWHEQRYESGFEIRRLRLTFEGHAFTEKLRYKFQWNTRTNGGSPSLTDGWIEYGIGECWAVRAGQFKDPVHREELVSARNQLAVERSLVNESVGGGINGRTQGVGIAYGNDSPDTPLNLDLVVHDGAGQANTPFEDGDFDFGLSARAEYKLTGPWSAYRDFSARDLADLAVVGAAVSWSQAGDADLVTATADAHWETSWGLGAFGALLVARAEGEGAFVLPDGTNWGALLQAGYLLDPAWELFCRADFVDFARPPTASNEGPRIYWEFTFGVNYFLGSRGSAGHRAKLSFDITYLPQGAPADLVSPASLGAAGNAGDEQWVLRGQFQLVI